MIESVIVQYVGFSSKAEDREYTFAVREAGTEPREFILTISNEAFESHRVRYQDAPDICSLRLHRELTTNENHPSETHFCVTETELADYRDARRPKPLRGFQPQGRN